MDETFEQHIDRLDKSGYLKNYSGMAMNMCGAFWWSTQPEGKEATILQNGTVCFVNTGSRHIGITCDHVFQGYLDDKRQHENVECQFGNNRFDPEKYLIDRSPESKYDLATFEVPEVFVTASLRHYHHNALKWPPDPAIDKNVLLYGGYPQVLRDPKGNQVEFPFQWFVSPVSSIDPDRMILDPVLDRLYWPGHEGEQINMKWWGQSGGPVYRVVDASPVGSVVDRLELVGFIYRQWGTTTILARPAFLVDANGEIHQPPDVETSPAIEP